jgi:integrase
MALTDIECKRAVCPLGKAQHRVADEKGMYLEVLPSGGKYWRLKYRILGKEKRLALGVYPDVSLAQARKARDDARTLIQAGEDPGQLKKDAKQARSVSLGNTFEAVAKGWFDNWRETKTERHADQVWRRLQTDVFPAIGGKPVADVTPLHLVNMAQAIERRGTADLARRMLQTSAQVFRYAAVNGLIKHNPALNVKPADALKPHRQTNHARLDERELPELLRKIEAYVGHPCTRLAMKLMALTFVRTGELINAKWEEFDLDAAEWRIPAERMKMRSPHIVPLSSQSIDALRVLHTITGGRAILFQGERDHNKPMSNNTILAALKRMGYGGRMTGHGFRGIASTSLHEQGWAHHLIELQLAHIERDNVAAAYNHATYLADRRQMMQAWGDHLDALRTSGRVIQLKRA